MGSDSRQLARNWSFTSYTTDEESGELLKPNDDLEWNEYINGSFWQEEICPNTQRRHVQGYVQFAAKKRISTIKKYGNIWQNAHLEVARGTVQENRIYCSKPESGVIGTFEEIGILSQQGGEKEFDSARNDLTGGASSEYIRQSYPGTWIRHTRAIKEFIEDRDRIKPDSWGTLITTEELKTWQKRILLNIVQTPNPRTVNWIYDPIGGAGKSTFIKYVIQMYGEDHVQAIMSTKMERVIAVLKAKPQTRCVFIDIPRSYPMDKFNYQILEVLKDQIGFNTMYNPGQVFTGRIHLYVMSNSEPDRSKLTNDRWNVRQISEVIRHYVE
nr:MAG: replication associated protein [Cressdnaviricota sp.]